MMAVALVMYACARFIPRAEATDPGLKINYNPFTATWQVIRFAAKTRAIFLSLLGISWFWLVGALTPRTAARRMRVTCWAATRPCTRCCWRRSRLGTALGSLCCEKLSGHKVEIGLVPLGSIGMTVCLLDLYFEQPGHHAAAERWSPGCSYLREGGWDVVLDCALIGVFGGLFIVPLYALILQRSTETHRARIIACNNILNAGFMVLAAVLAIVWLEVLELTHPAAVHPRRRAQRRGRHLHLLAGA